MEGMVVVGGIASSFFLETASVCNLCGGVPRKRNSARDRSFPCGLTNLEPQVCLSF